MAFALWVNRALIEEDKQGHVSPPGSGHAKRWKQPDDSEVLLVSRGQAFDLYIGKERMYNLSITSKVAVSMAWWILVWWVNIMWFGLKGKLWNWSLHRIVGRQRAD